MTLKNSLRKHIITPQVSSYKRFRDCSIRASGNAPGQISGVIYFSNCYVPLTGQKTNNGSHWKAGKTGGRAISR